MKKLFRAKCRDAVSHWRSKTTDSYLTLGGIPTHLALPALGSQGQQSKEKPEVKNAKSAKTAAKPLKRRSRDEESKPGKRLVFTGEPGAYTTEFDAAGNFCVYRTDYDSPGEENAQQRMTSDTIRDMNRNHAAFWGQKR